MKGFNMARCKISPRFVKHGRPELVDADITVWGGFSLTLRLTRTDTDAVLKIRLSNQTAKQLVELISHELTGEQELESTKLPPNLKA